MHRSPLLERHEAGGARLADRPEAPGIPSPLFFGDVPSEYQAARKGCALFDTSDRGRVTVEGPEGADFLHRLLANHVKSLGSERVNENLLLSPKGKILFDFDLTRNGERFELSTGPGRAAGLAEALERYRFAEKLRIEDTSANHAPLELAGTGARGVLERLLEGPRDLEPGSRETLALPQGPLEIQALPSGAWRLDGGPTRVETLWNDLVEAGAVPTGLVVRDSLRVESGRALSGVDVDENVYPQEANLVNAFALDKGCYVGQEVVAKIDTYGGLNKRLLALRLDHSDPVPRGTRLVMEEGDEIRELGLVTSWAYSFALDTGMVLAYVKRRSQEPGTTFTLEGGAGTAQIVTLPIVPAS